MITKVYEAEIVFGKRKLAITNTEFEISVDWNLFFDEVDDALSLKVVINRVFGKFFYREKNEEITKKVEIQFETSSKWEHKWSVDKSMNKFYEMSTTTIFPDNVSIDFDNKTARVCF